MKRESNYELLRVVSALAVIILHVSNTYVYPITGEAQINGIEEHMLVNCIYNTVFRFAIPCFIMLSGTFTLEHEKNQDFKYYYRKVFKTIGVPTIIVSALYVLYSFVGAALAIIKGQKPIILLELVKSILTGEPHYHLWYLYMMAGIFILTPIVVGLKKELGEQCFTKVALIFFPLAMLSLWTSTHKLNWDLGLSFCYLGYYMLGYVLRKKFCTHKNNLHACLTIALGCIVLLGAAYLRYQQLLSIYLLDGWQYDFYSPYSPITAIASVLIFTGFTMMKVKGVLDKLASITFEIYLFHAGIWSFVYRILPKGTDSIIAIPVSVILVFTISIFVSLAYKKIWNRVERKINILFINRN